VSGTVLPVSYHEQLQLIVDPELLAVPQLFFNAARLDRSIALSTEDYVRLTELRIERITAP
jgi:Ala-tRNA(Pro) deacylase